MAKADETVDQTATDQTTEATPEVPSLADAPVPPGDNPAVPDPHVAATDTGTTGKSNVPDHLADDELTVGQFIDRHFARLDMNINGMAEHLRLEVSEVIDILKELGYTFPNGM